MHGTDVRPVTQTTSEQREEGDARDAALMRQLAIARSRADGGLQADLLLAKLLALHEANIRRIVRYRTYRAQPADVEQLVNRVRLRVATAVENNFDPNVPFGALVAKNIEWEVIDWARGHERRDRDVPTEHGDAVVAAGSSGEDPVSLVEEARRLRELIAGLPARDQEIVADRFLFGLDPVRIAEKHGTTRRAIDTATSRALKRLATDEAFLAARNSQDVRDREHGSECEAT